MVKKNSPRKRRVKPKVIQNAGLATMISASEDGGVIISTVSVSYTFTFRTPRIQASLVVLPDLPCSHCDKEGVLFVGGLCIRCKEEFHRALCLRSFATLTHDGKMALDAEALLCAKCNELDVPAVNQLPLALGPMPGRIRARWN
jgi:hypothetical protein